MAFENAPVPSSRFQVHLVILPLAAVEASVKRISLFAQATAGKLNFAVGLSVSVIDFATSTEIQPISEMAFSLMV